MLDLTLCCYLFDLERLCRFVEDSWLWSSIVLTADYALLEVVISRGSINAFCLLEEPFNDVPLLDLRYLSLYYYFSLFRCYYVVNCYIYWPFLIYCSYTPLPTTTPYRLSTLLNLLCYPTPSPTTLPKLLFPSSSAAYSLLTNLYPPVSFLAKRFSISLRYQTSSSSMALLMRRY